MKSRRSELDTSCVEAPQRTLPKKRQDIAITHFKWTIQTSSEVTQDVHRRQWSVFFSHAGNIFFVSKRKEDTTKVRTRFWAFRPLIEFTFSTLQQEVHIQDFRLIWLKILPSALSLWRLCNDSCSSYSWPSGGTPTLSKGTKGHCLWHPKLRLCGCSNETTHFSIQSQLTSREQPRA